ncbi:hypothetical protein KO561_00785 [Radiobacillus kanasensis]|uniref:CdaR family protein n=1 Tax=Radiobacillus kanasensis TaxID=2844358 RepID=UPI001E63B7D7|nr:CdaR family protein [Radiobacillus kanasensis]UFT99549.1 hypothetical protein KO561_00785 [Radiobacillus kanasensis]
MDNWLKSRWAIQIVSLALALLLFVSVSLDENADETDLNGTLFGGTEETQKVEDIPVDIRIDNDKYVVSGVPQTVTVTLEGPTDEIQPAVIQQNFDVFVDLEDLEPGTHTVNMQHSGISDDLNVYIEPNSIEVVIEEKATEEFDIAIDYINTQQIEPGFELGEAVVDPKTVRITSAKSVVDQIAIVKVFVDVAGVDEPIENREVPVKVYDSQGNELSVLVEPETVEVSVDVNNPNKEVSIRAATTGELPEGITLENMKVEPETATVFAAEDYLAELQELTTEEIDLSKIEKDTTLEVELNRTDAMRKTSPEKAKVTIDVTRTIEKSFTDVPIDVENLQDGYSLAFVEPNSNAMDITVLGPEDVINELNKNQLSLAINVSDRETGEYELPIQLNGPDNVEWKSDVEQAVVRIEEE